MADSIYNPAVPAGGLSFGLFSWTSGAGLVFSEYVSLVDPSSGQKMAITANGIKVDPTAVTTPATIVSTSGATITLVNGAATLSTNYPSTLVGYAKRMTLHLSVSAAATVTIQTSPDNVNWFQATLPNVTTSANQTFGAAGTISLALTPALYVRVNPSASLTTMIAVLEAAY